MAQIVSLSNHHRGNVPVLINATPALMTISPHRWSVFLFSFVFPFPSVLREEVREFGRLMQVRLGFMQEDWERMVWNML